MRAHKTHVAGALSSCTAGDPTRKLRNPTLHTAHPTLHTLQPPLHTPGEGDDLSAASHGATRAAESVVCRAPLARPLHPRRIQHTGPKAPEPKP